MFLGPARYDASYISYLKAIVPASGGLGAGFPRSWWRADEIQNISPRYFVFTWSTSIYRKTKFENDGSFLTKSIGETVMMHSECSIHIASGSPTTP